MRHFNILIAIFLMFSACKQQNKPSEPVALENYEPYGTQIVDINPVESKIMLENYKKMSKSDTLVSQFSGRVKEVCKVKGCWMKLELGNGEETMVKFKDYGFFMSGDIVGKKVIVDGLAFIEEVGVEDQQHLAYDGGSSKEEIAKITSIKKTYSFEAEGVLINK